MEGEVRRALRVQTEELERLLLPQAGWTQGHRIHLPEAQDPHELYKLGVIRRALAILDAARAYLEGRQTAVPPCFSHEDADTVESNLECDLDRDAYAHLVEVANSVCSLLTSIGRGQL